MPQTANMNPIAPLTKCKPWAHHGLSSERGQGHAVPAKRTRVPRTGVTPADPPEAESGNTRPEHCSPETHSRPTSRPLLPEAANVPLAQGVCRDTAKAAVTAASARDDPSPPIAAALTHYTVTSRPAQAAPSATSTKATEDDSTRAPLQALLLDPHTSNELSP